MIDDDRDRVSLEDDYLRGATALDSAGRECLLIVDDDFTGSEAWEFIKRSARLRRVESSRLLEGNR